MLFHYYFHYSLHHILVIKIQLGVKKSISISHIKLFRNSWDILAEIYWPVYDCLGVSTTVFSIWFPLYLWVLSHFNLKTLLLSYPKHFHNHFNCLHSKCQSTFFMCRLSDGCSLSLPLLDFPGYSIFRSPSLPTIVTDSRDLTCYSGSVLWCQEFEEAFFRLQCAFVQNINKGFLRGIRDNMNSQGRSCKKCDIMIAFT